MATATGHYYVLTDAGILGSEPIIRLSEHALINLNQQVFNKSGCPSVLRRESGVRPSSRGCALRSQPKARYRLP